MDSSALALASTYRLVLLIKIVDVTVQNLHEKLDGYGGVHASICYSKCSLQTFKHTLAVPIQLMMIISMAAESMGS